MRNLFRYLLTIMIVVLPLQGTAAMVMSYGGGMAMAQTLQATQRVDDTMDEMASAPAADEHCVHSATSAAKAKISHVKCNASVNCCIGAAAPPSVLARLPVQSHSTEEASSLEPAMTGFVPPTLERPPRQS